MSNKYILVVIVAVLFNVSDAAKVFLPRGKPSNDPNLPLFGARLAVVAAHHNEDLTWLDAFAQRCENCHVFVYTSSLDRAGQSFRHGTVRQVPNVGREWGKYLRFITDEWSALVRTDATVLFLHAHRQPNGADDQDRGNLESVLPRWPTNDVNRILFLHGQETIISIGTPDPLDYGSLIRNLWPRLFTELGTSPMAQPGDSTSLNLFCISSAEFSVPVRQIVRLPRPFYERLEQWLISRNPPVHEASAFEKRFEAVSFDYAAGTILELLAYNIFQGRKPVDLRDAIVSANQSLLKPAIPDVAAPAKARRLPDSVALLL